VQVHRRRPFFEICAMGSPAMLLVKEHPASRGQMLSCVPARQGHDLWVYNSSFHAADLRQYPD